MATFGGGGASQMHKGIPHLHSKTLWVESFLTAGSELLSATESMSNLAIESVTALTPFETDGSSSFFNLHRIKHTDASEKLPLNPLTEKYMKKGTGTESPDKTKGESL